MRDAQNLGDVVAAHDEDSSTVAVVDLRNPEEPVQVTHRDLARMAGGVAAHLAGRGLRPGERVGILALNRVEYLAAYFGAMLAGGVAVPLSIKLPAESLAYIIDDAGLRLAFVDAGRRHLVPPGLDVVDFDDPGPDGFAASVVAQEFAAVEPPDGAEAELLYTSGSSGRPKGVSLTHAGQLWALRTMAATRPAQRHTQILAQPLFHMNGLVTVALALLSADTVILQPAFAAGPYAAAIEHYAVDTVAAVPTMWVRTLREAEAGRADLSSVRTLTLGSAPTSDELIARTRALLPECRVSLSYGTTEAGPAVFGPHPDGLPTPPRALGYPLPGSDLRLVDGPSPDEGVLLMRNPAVMRGYHNLPERTSAVVRDDWYTSGDVMRRDEDGFYTFVGRADDMFVCAGENIYPGEVERLLERNPAVHQAAVVSLPDPERGRIPVAFVVPVDDRPLDAASVKEHALRHGAPHLHPRRVSFRPDLPLAGTNKTDRNALAQLAIELERTHGWSP
ncbi:class I adenylate-forming enzyme family protein [Pseudonocardia acaciae]|uniref:class I adenylate-forming enzyme family protein n=1 Tax=Pseudonocardia acaciae TaxID=551276 RepID=UPI00048BA44D|nr:class I adenylate-forming enzyme family protein [Pseudonocardia acaciae]